MTSQKIFITHEGKRDALLWQGYDTLLSLRFIGSAGDQSATGGLHWRRELVRSVAEALSVTLLSVPHEALT